jgi:membrane fusion protein (multidrug efflux system)
VLIDVNEKDLALLAVGQPARITTAAFPGRSFNGKVSYIKPFLSPSSRTASVEIELPNPSFLLKPGMYAGTTVTLPATQGIFIPLSAIIRQPGTADDYVFTIEGGKAHKIPVKQLQTENDLVQIEGVPAGTTVITSGKSRLKENTRVTLKTTSPS